VLDTKNKNAYFPDEKIQQLMEEYTKINRTYESLLIKYTSKQFANSQAKEFATHGFVRRLKILVRCIHNIYKICPPERNCKFSNEELSDTTINLQSFILNIFGCLDNLAWVWVKEKNIKNDEGNELQNHQIGFGERYENVRKSFSSKIKCYLETESQKEWYAHLKNFRDALAHRIPLYIPPYIVNEEEAAMEHEIEVSRMDALKKYNFTEYERLSKELESIGRFVPWMTHSFSEQSRTVVFPAQIIADWNTIVEISDLFLEEI